MCTNRKYTLRLRDRTVSYKPPYAQSQHFKKLLCIVLSTVIDGVCNSYFIINSDLLLKRLERKA